jgi:hypothetical protein
LAGRTTSTLRHPDRTLSERSESKGEWRDPRIQLLTVRDLLEGTKSVQRPLHVRDNTFRRAPRSRPTPATNFTLNLTGEPEE